MDDQPVEKEIITLGGGCFWCIEAVFLEINGVVKVESDTQMVI
jgi:peptide-methionine (S)-S-oxide reductase